MRFSLSLNSEHVPTADAVKLAVQAEKQGLECVLYCPDLFKRDVWVFLTAVATQTRRIHLGTGIVNPYTVNPAELAIHAATLDEYSGGRLGWVLAWGLSSSSGGLGSRPVGRSRPYVSPLNSFDG